MAKRDKKAALRYLIKAFNQTHNTEIEIRQCQYLNNLIEQDHRGIKRIVRPMMGFKNFHSAQKTLAGIELMRMLRKGQMKSTAGGDQSPVEQFYTLAA